MGRGWVKAIAESPSLKDRITIVGLVDVDPAAADRLAAAFALDDALVASDIDRALGRLKPDVVFDVVVPSARMEVVRAAFAHGCHVLSEKPMATSEADAREMLRLAKAAGRMHAIVQNRRFNDGVRSIRATLESGGLGTLTALHCDFFVGAHFGGFREAMENVLLVDMAIHTFDAARFMAGKVPLAVYCHQSNPAGSWYAHGAAAEAIFEFADGVVFTYHGSWCAEGANTSWDAAWRIVGTRGSLLWDGTGRPQANVVVGQSGFVREVAPLPVVAADPARTLGHASVIADFIDSVETGRRPETDARDNFISLAMVLAAIQSASTGERVAVPVDGAG
jgi:predicted dehydrogenase